MATNMKSILLVAVIGFVLGLPLAAQGAQVVISDTDFADGDWAATVSYGVGNISHTEGQSLVDGNPGAFRSMEHRIVNPGHLFVFHQFLPAFYDPSVQGAIASLDYHEDCWFFNRGAPLAEVNVAPALLQDGIIYEGPQYADMFITWGPHDLTGLKAIHFDPADLVSAGNPDFSESGSPIYFGYRRAHSHVYSTEAEYGHGIDNWSYTVNIVPEPSAPASLLAALFVLTGCQARRRG